MIKYPARCDPIIPYEMAALTTNHNGRNTTGTGFDGDIRLVLALCASSADKAEPGRHGAEYRSLLFGAWRLFSHFIVWPTDSAESHWLVSDSLTGERAAGIYRWLPPRA